MQDGPHTGSRLGQQRHSVFRQLEFAKDSVLALERVVCPGGALFRVSGSRFGVPGLGFGVWGLGFGGWGFGEG